MNRLLLFVDNKAIDSWFNAALPLGATLARASVGTYINSAGTLTTATSNQPRFDHNPTTLVPLGLLLEVSRTNGIKNSTLAGAVAGSPGTLPTNWQESTIYGLSREVVGTGTEHGISYVDIRWYGTTTSSSSWNSGSWFTFADNTEIPAAVNDVWTVSAYLKLVAGSFSNVDLTFAIRQRTSGGSTAGQVSNNTPIATQVAAVTNLAAGRFSDTITLTGATTAYANPEIALVHGTGVAVDFTLRIGLPHFELGSTLTTPLITSGAAITRQADQLTITIPAGVSLIRIVFDNASTQDFIVTAGAYTILTSLLTRPHVKRIYDVTESLIGDENGEPLLTEGSFTLAMES